MLSSPLPCPWDLPLVQTNQYSKSKLHLIFFQKEISHTLMCRNYNYKAKYKHIHCNKDSNINTTNILRFEQKIKIQDYH